MIGLRTGRSGASAVRVLVPVLVLVLVLGCSHAQTFGETCLAKFKKGRTDFVLDVDDSVKDGATFISSPKLDRSKDCVLACCKNPQCNVAFMQGGSEEGLVQSCVLFDCLYKQKYVCRFVQKNGYISSILDSVFEKYLEVDLSPDVADHPPVANGGQDQVVQPLDSVTLTGIESKDDHGVVSYQWQMVSGNTFTVIEETTFSDQVIVSNLTSGVYKFQLTVTDTSGQSDSTQVTVLVLTPEESEDHCMAPKKIGPCRGAFPRWHYNAISEKCEQFIFGGCRENLNNYLSLQECSTACHGSEKDEKSGRTISVPVPKVEKCGVTCTPKQFTCENGCCLDQGLECDKDVQCSDGSDEKNCVDLDDEFQVLLKIPVNEQKVRCTEPPSTGSCRDTFTKWYYNPVHQDCFRFNYGGCKGTDNRFETKDSCLTTCSGVTENDIFARKEEFERQLADSHTGVVAIAAILGLAILILLGILAYCFYKGKKKSPQHHRVPVSNIPVAALDDREHLVYNNTTKPI
ncbi:kunitz-type protease inhibitor 1a [Thalassophryne amazonica]|uniref:kunitz-type protease inhibitor 1a n=1 Tax=Thalassophryne amazonica TaxID=390379 RepID=UPI001471B373|nr:kunitz-type protease inhibitor 1a [Thalassophryne amazonica]